MNAEIGRKRKELNNVQQAITAAERHHRSLERTTIFDAIAGDKSARSSDYCRKTEEKSIGESHKIQKRQYLCYDDFGSGYL